MIDAEILSIVGGHVLLLPQFADVVGYFWLLLIVIVIVAVVGSGAGGGAATSYIHTASCCIIRINEECF